MRQTGKLEAAFAAGLGLASMGADAEAKKQTASHETQAGKEKAPPKHLMDAFSFLKQDLSKNRRFEDFMLKIDRDIPDTIDIYSVTVGAGAANPSDEPCLPLPSKSLGSKSQKLVAFI